MITDANGCTTQGGTTLTQPDPLQLSFSNVTGVSCNGYEDGSAQLIITGGITPYQILWQNGSFSDHPDNLPGGINEVQVSDSYNNGFIEQVNIPQPDPIQIVLQSPQYANGFHVSCYDCFNGSITSTVSGGTAPYTYLCDGSGNGQTTANISNLNAGDYILLATDAHNCILEEAIKLRMPERQDWSMTGNTGTDPNTQFIGTTDPVDVVFKRNNQETILLTENGTLYIESIFIRPTNSNFRYPDYVFKKGYKLTPLLELKTFLKKEEHLPGLKSEKDVLKEGGYSLNELTLQLLKKQEETTLYLIEMKEENERMKQELEALKNRLI